MNKLTENALIEFYGDDYVHSLKEKVAFLDKGNLTYENLSTSDKKVVDEIIEGIDSNIIEVATLVDADYYDGKRFYFKHLIKHYFYSDDYRSRLNGHFESLYFYADLFKRIGNIISEYNKKTLEVINLTNLTSVLGYACFIQNQIHDDYELDNIGNYQYKDATFSKDMFDSLVLYNNVLKRKNQVR